jgi:phytoene synthase
MKTMSTRSVSRQLRRHGKSFYLAHLFLGKQQARHTQKLYNICRSLDDLVDKPQGKTNKAELIEAMIDELQNDNITHPLLLQANKLTSELHFQQNEWALLLDGLLLDTQSVNLKTQQELEDYAYKVAGSVGLMMCYILGVTDPKAKPHAVALGIAMQLTNILRDVKEDYQLARQYIPMEWLGTRQTVAMDMELLRPALERLYILSESFYKYAAQGFKYLRPRSRFSVIIASLLYREIGHLAKQKNFDVLSRRIVVPRFSKTILILKSIFIFLSQKNNYSKEHA